MKKLIIILLLIPCFLDAQVYPDEIELSDSTFSLLVSDDSKTYGHVELEIRTDSLCIESGDCFMPILGLGVESYSIGYDTTATPIKGFDITNKTKGVTVNQFLPFDPVNDTVDLNLFPLVQVKDYTNNAWNEKELTNQNFRIDNYLDQTVVNDTTVRIKIGWTDQFGIGVTYHDSIDIVVGGGSAQTLSFSDPDLSISDGNSVDLSALKDGNGYWTENVTDLYTTTHNQIGVGTSAPSSSLHIIHNSSSTDNVLRIGASSINFANPNGIELLESSGSFGTAGNYGVKMFYDGSANIFKLQTGNSTTVTDVLNIPRDGGFLGVGVTPSQKLHVEGNFLLTGGGWVAVGQSGNVTDAGEIRFLETTNGNWNNGFRFRLDGAANELICESKTTGAEVPHLTMSRATGDVEIGNDLDVLGRVNVSDLTGTGTTILMTSGGDDIVEGTLSSDFSISGGELQFSGGLWTESTQGRIYRNSGESLPYVGIQTTAPSHELHVNGSIRIESGTIIDTDNSGGSTGQYLGRDAGGVHWETITDNDSQTLSWNASLNRITISGGNNITISDITPDQYIGRGYTSGLQTISSTNEDKVNIITSSIAENVTVSTTLERFTATQSGFYTASCQCQISAPTTAGTVELRLKKNGTQPTSYYREMYVDSSNDKLIQYSDDIELAANDYIEFFLYNSSSTDKRIENCKISLRRI